MTYPLSIDTLVWIFCSQDVYITQLVQRLESLHMSAVVNTQQVSVFPVSYGVTWAAIVTEDCFVDIYIYICGPLCEIQAKVSKSNYEITSIKVLFLPSISLYFQFLPWPYSVNTDIKGNIFTECSLQYEYNMIFCRKQQITKKRL